MKGEVRLKKGRAAAFKRGYPLVRRADIATESDCLDGEIVTVLDSDGRSVGLGSYFGKSHVPVRLFLEEGESPGPEMFTDRFRACLELRKSVRARTTGYRAVFAEADRLPGLVVDMFGPHAVVQVRTLAMERLKPVWLPCLQEVFDAESVYERSDFAARQGEGLDLVSGQLVGETPDLARIQEGGIQFDCPVKTGLKTGHYFDQRESRKRLAQEVREGETVLDLFCSTGGFSLVAAKSGAKVTGIDLDTASIEAALRNAGLNGLDAEFVIGNAYEHLAETRQTYDWIVLDPPAIAKHKGQKNSLRQALFKLVSLSLPRLNKSGKMVVCTCSYQLSLEEMLETIADAAGGAGANLGLAGITTQGEDHPVPLNYPEAWYLKCVWLQHLS